jgi:serine/threonine-protein kinase
MTRTQAIINGRYRVGRRLGQGGMALVYAGHDLLLGRDVAIKTLRPEFASDPAFRARFEREARAAAALSHPNIIDIFDVGEEGGQPFIVMELVRGKSLREIIAAEAPFHPTDVAELLEQVGSALDYAHARGYVHRDIKPGNILVDEHGRARVVDFGIAKGLADADLTETGGGFGTVGFISPEQAEGLMATPASYFYSGGVVAYLLLTGSLLFPA